MAIPKPWRSPKSLEKMKSGKMARDKGEKHQEKVANYLRMTNRWPFRGIDIKGAIFSVEAKSLDSAYPGMVENLLQEAELKAKKGRPESIAILNIHKADFGKMLDHDLIILRMKDFRWLLERLEG